MFRFLENGNFILWIHLLQFQTCVDLKELSMYYLIFGKVQGTGPAGGH